MSRLYQRKRFINFGAFVLALLGSFKVAYADPISSAFGTLYKLGLPVAILIGLALIVLNGYGLMTSDGDPKKVQESKDGLFSAIIGLAFVVLAMVIFRVIVTSLIPSRVDQGRIF
ncbi:MAG TPA: hypothetical protein PLT50_01890 [bacterium]|nr:hypothetical protein [bacterium]